MQLPPTRQQLFAAAQGQRTQADQNQRGRLRNQTGCGNLLGGHKDVIDSYFIYDSLEVTAMYYMSQGIIAANAKVGPRHFRRMRF